MATTTTPTLREAKLQVLGDLIHARTQTMRLAFDSVNDRVQERHRLRAPGDERLPADFALDTLVIFLDEVGRDYGFTRQQWIDLVNQVAFTGLAVTRPAPQGTPEGDRYERGFLGDAINRIAGIE